MILRNAALLITVNAMLNTVNDSSNLTQRFAASTVYSEYWRESSNDITDVQGGCLSARALSESNWYLSSYHSFSVFNFDRT